MTYKSFDPKQLPLPQKHGYMLTGVAPRPIALVSSISADGESNLAPFSNFNAFGSEPPILVFSASRSGRTGLTKDTYKNIKEVGEVVIGVVEYENVYKISLASCEFEKGISEFEKAGFTPKPASIVKPSLIQDCRINYECKVLEIKEMGDKGGAGNLAICEVVQIHIDEKLLDENDKINPLDMNIVARCGGPYYVTAEPTRMFPITQPQGNLGIGVDALPEEIRLSDILTGNDIARIGSNTSLPSDEEINEFKNTESYKYLMSFEGEERQNQFHLAAREMLKNNNKKLATICLFSNLNS